MKKYKVLFISGVANSFEWYDYALFGHFVSVLGPKFFPDSDPSTSLLHTFLAFAVGYLMRPLGGLFFGILGDKYGRRTSLSAAVICMSLPTVFIGFLPTYDSIGIAATTALIVLRMLQGLSMGGVLTGSISFAVEHTNVEDRGLISSVTMSSICVGILLGAAASNLTKLALSEESFYEWGWRLPFIFGILIFFMGQYIKHNTDETPFFEEVKSRGEVVRSPLKMVVKNHFFDMLISIMVNATGSVIFYLVAIYALTYLEQYRNFNIFAVNSLLTVCYIIMMFATIFVGWLSDRIGRQRIFFINLLIIIFVTPFLLETLEVGSFFRFAVLWLHYRFWQQLISAQSQPCKLNFTATNIRNTALSISYNIATSVFGGTAPFIIEKFYQATNSLTSITYYIISLAVLSLFGLYFYENRYRREYLIQIDTE